MQHQVATDCPSVADEDRNHSQCGTVGCQIDIEHLSQSIAELQNDIGGGKYGGERTSIGARYKPLDLFYQGKWHAVGVCSAFCAEICALFTASRQTDLCYSGGAAARKVS